MCLSNLVIDLGPDFFSLWDVVRYNTVGWSCDVGGESKGIAASTVLPGSTGGVLANWHTDAVPGLAFS